MPRYEVTLTFSRGSSVRVYTITIGSSFHAILIVLYLKGLKLIPHLFSQRCRASKSCWRAAHGQGKRFLCLEAIQNRAIRVYLGVHKFAPLLELEGDMGWMSCEHQHLSILRLWNRILKLPDDRLTKKIFINDYYLAQSEHKNCCWNVFKILEKINLEKSFYERTS